MRLNAEVWKKVLALNAECEKNSEPFTRSKIKEKLNICEREARNLYDLFRDRHVILKSGGFHEQAALASQNRKLRNSLKEVSVEVRRLARIAEIQADIKCQSLVIPKFAMPGTGRSSAIACAMLSDTHFDEVVNPAEIGWVNAYDRKIATARLERYFKSLVKLKNVHFSGINIDGLVLMLAGDMVSGTIHDELAATNQYPITDTIVYYCELLTAGINMLREHYKQLFIPCVVGNHGRLTPKVKFKGASTDNYDYLLYSMVASQFKGKAGVQFYVPVSPDAIFPVGNTTFCLTHGNQFRGGGGWSGPVLPIFRGDSKKRDRQSSVKSPYDVLCLAHFHSLKFMGKQICNGALIGFNEFAHAGNFGFEPPQQAFFLVDEKHGVTITSPVHCKLDVEPWEERKDVGMMFAK